MKDKFEGFVFSKKRAARSGANQKDVSITIQKGTAPNQYCYGFAIRNQMGDMILDNKNYIKLGLRGSCLYFIPTNSADDGFTFGRRSKQSCTNRYSTISTKNFPALQRYVTKEVPFNGSLQYDKDLELYFVDLMGGKR